MKREILFRGKAINNKNWTIGGFTLDAIGNPRITTLDYSKKGLIFHEVIPETIGQFTGLTDKNGVKIFEGDIVTTGRLQYFIKYEDGAFYAYHCKIKDVYLTPYRWGRLARFEELNREIEVMDNIHDNPELLK